MRTAMIAMTTSNSISVNPFRRWREPRILRMSHPRLSRSCGRLSGSEETPRNPGLRRELPVSDRPRSGDMSGARNPHAVRIAILRPNRSFDANSYWSEICVSTTGCLSGAGGDFSVAFGQSLSARGLMMAGALFQTMPQRPSGVMPKHSSNGL